MNKEDLEKMLLESLCDLEEVGDIVITYPDSSVIARRLSSRIISLWAREFVEAPPCEVVISSSTENSAAYISRKFGLDENVALNTVSEFVGNLSASRTLQEISDLVCHQGYQEIALGAYYCSYLKRGDYYSLGYLDWRKEINSREKNA
jgi:hypothetical protein